MHFQLLPVSVLPHRMHFCVGIVAYTVLGEDGAKPILTRSVGSVIGIGGTVGALGGMGMALFTGYILDATGSYEVLFAICASAYVLALAAVHLLSPRLGLVRVHGSQTS